MVDVDTAIARLGEDIGRDLTRLLTPSAHPRLLEPQLATNHDGTPLGDGWIHERKLDGVRLLAHVHGREVRLLTRTGTDRTGTFPEIEAALVRSSIDDAVLDAEVVALDGEHTSFSLLQRRLGAPGRPTASVRAVPTHLYGFDLVHLDGRDLRRLPLYARKHLLGLLSLCEPVRHTDHETGPAEAALATACARGWEGLIAKRADAPYRAGRTTAWRKLRCEHDGRFVVGGWTPPQGSRQGIGALLLGEASGDALRYVGRVGTGFDDRMLATLGNHLRRIGDAPCPFVPPPTERGARWTIPHLVVDVRFAGWTEAGRIRHPRLTRLRPDLSVGDAVGDLARP